jgi:hypothetical protein
VVQNRLEVGPHLLTCEEDLPQPQVPPPKDEQLRRMLLTSLEASRVLLE